MRRINHRDFGLNSLIVEPRVIPEWKAFWRNEKRKSTQKKYQEQIIQWLRRNR